MSIYKIIAKFNPERAFLKLLRDNEDGLNIQMLVDKTAMLGSHGKSKANKTVDSLKQKGKIKERRIGQSRVFYINEQQKIFNKGKR